MFIYSIYHVGPYGSFEHIFTLKNRPYTEEFEKVNIVYHHNSQGDILLKEKCIEFWIFQVGKKMGRLFPPWLLPPLYSVWWANICFPVPTTLNRLFICHPLQPRALISVWHSAELFYLAIGEVKLKCRICSASARTVIAVNNVSFSHWQLNSTDSPRQQHKGDF